MRHHREIAILVAAIGAIAHAACAGYDEPKVAFRSDELAKISSHVVVGKVLGYRKAQAPDSEPAPSGNRRFETEIVIDRVEAGSDLRKGDRIRVGFWSPLSREQIETLPKLAPFGCSDFQIPPQPGDLARVYLNRKGPTSFVTDHPSGLFALDPGPRRPYVARARSPKTLPTAGLGTLGAVAGIITLTSSIGVIRRRPVRR